MAISYDTSTTYTATGTLLEWSHTVTSSGSVRALFVTVSVDGLSSYTITATYNSVSMTAIVNTTLASDRGRAMIAWC